MSAKAKSLAVQQLQAHSLNMGAAALSGSYRNAFKDVTREMIYDLIKNSSFLIRDSVYSSLISGLLSGWR